MKSVIIIIFVTLHLGKTDSESRMRNKRAWIIETFTIEEEYSGTYPYLLGTISVMSEHWENLKLWGPGVTEEPTGLFSMNRHTGEFFVNKRVDYECLTVMKNDTITLKLEVLTEPGVVNERLAVVIEVKDINDNAPQFSSDVYETSVEGSVAQETALIMVDAKDKDKPGTSNSIFDFRIISVAPSPTNVEFFIQQQGNNGAISFKGCLYNEKVDKYTIVVEAKDRGDKVQLSSSSTVIIHILDKNNYTPVFSGHTGSGRVKERESRMSPLRIHVTDKDTKGTAAWRVRYTIKGDRQGNFQIQTDPETNDGILTVIKPLDYEESSERHLSITIENEKPYFTCQVKRKTSIGPWEVINSVATPLSKNFTIMVEDTNDPPTFTETVKEVWVEENKETGYPLGSLFAKDPDRFFSSDIMYMKGGDPGDWVNVNLQTCEITTARTLDRESVHVVNNTYTVTVYAVDKGRPPLTGTGTLIIHILDQNDELPQLKESALSMCLSDRPTTATVSAFDLDEHPHSGPFRFELLGDVKEEWDISPTHGTTVNLSMKSRAYTGRHQLQLKVYDLEGSFSLQTLSVTVCDCSVTPTCMTRASASTGVGGSAIVIMLFASLVLLGLLLIAISVSCKRRVFQIIKEDPNESWLSFNVESPGTDCEVPCLPLLMQADNLPMENRLGQVPCLPLLMQADNLPMENRLGQVIQKQEPPDFKSPRNNDLPVNGGFTKEDKVLWSLLGQVVQHSLTDCQELSDYNPRVYAYEGDLSPDAELESICTDEEEANFSPQDLLELDQKFIKLAEILIPHPALR